MQRYYLPIGNNSRHDEREDEPEVVDGADQSSLPWVAPKVELQTKHYLSSNRIT